MKLVTFEVATPVGPARRLGALIDGDENGRICDLTESYAAYLAAKTDEPTPRGLALLRTPPDMIGWLRGAHESRAAAEHAVAFARTHAEAFAPGSGRLVYSRHEVRLMAPLPRPNSLRDFSIYQDHMSKADVPFEKTEHWYVTPPYYKGNCDTITGPEDPVPYPYYTKRLDLELEIGIVVGKKGSNLTFEEAKACIAGYTILVDGSCRDGYGREPFGPTKRKDFNTTLGPCMTTAHEIDERNYSRLRSLLSAGSPAVLAAAANLVASREATGQAEAAAQLRTDALRACLDRLGSDHPYAASLRDGARINADIEPTET